MCITTRLLVFTLRIDHSHNANDTAPKEKGNKFCLDIKDILQSHWLIILNVVYTDLESVTRITVAPTPLKKTTNSLGC